MTVQCHSQPLERAIQIGARQTDQLGIEAQHALGSHGGDRGPARPESQDVTRDPLGLAQIDQDIGSGRDQPLA